MAVIVNDFLNKPYDLSHGWVSKLSVVMNEFYVLKAPVG